MKITFLGTGTSQGVPVIGCRCAVCSRGATQDHRLRSSVLIEHEDLSIVIDAGPDFRYQMLRQKVMKLDGILVTHAHKDHIGGMDDVRSFNWITKKAVDVYANKTAQEAIITTYPYAFEEISYPGVPSYNLITIGTAPFSIKGLDIRPFEVLHMGMPVLGFRIGDFAYITDANYLPSATLKALAGCKVIVLNALRKEKHISHFNLEEAIHILEFLRPERAYLTHISHLMGFHDEVSKELPNFISLAYDGFTIDV